MKSYGSRFCRGCGKLFPLSEPDDQVCAACRQSPAPAGPPAAPIAVPAAPPAAGKQHRDPGKRAPRPKRAGAGRNDGPVSGQRTLPMLRALAASPAGLTTPQLAEYASSATSWVNALGSVRQLMLKQERQGRVFQAGTVPGDRTRGSVLWRLTEAGERHVREQGDAAGPDAKGPEDGDG